MDNILICNRCGKDLTEKEERYDKENDCVYCPECYDYLESKLEDNLSEE